MVGDGDQVSLLCLPSHCLLMMLSFLQYTLVDSLSKVRAVGVYVYTWVLSSISLINKFVLVQSYLNTKDLYHYLLSGLVISLVAFFF